MSVSLVNNLLLQQLLNDVLNGDDAHGRRALLSTESCCARYTALRRLQCIVSVSHNADDLLTLPGLCMQLNYDNQTS